jgi:CubicO group peptidase (beta-lactamase class C family)
MGALAAAGGCAPRVSPPVVASAPATAMGTAPAATPAPPALVPALQDTVRKTLLAGLAASAYPGAYAIIGTADRVLARVSVGQLDVSPSPVPDAETLWDLASLTKVVATTSAVMQLVEQGRVELDAPVQRYLPAFVGAGKERVTIRHLLTHSSGMPSWRPLYKEAPTADTARLFVLATPLDTAAGVRYVYSDLGAILLGLVVERVSGEPLDQYVQRHVLAPLGMTSTMYLPPAALAARAAPTEIDPWRQRHLRGEVHDENAHALGGVSGHAGLFGTATDLSRLARAYLKGGVLDGQRVWADSTIRLFTARQDPAVSHRALGWETPSGTNSAGHRMSARAFGHTGFTGTSFWVDPEAGVYVILLTNRVNPTRERSGIGTVRAALADAVLGLAHAGTLGASSSSPGSHP